ncbi:MAG: carboxyl transferase domain-containing protein [Candidatus Kapaibacteriales bacterium]
MKKLLSKINKASEEFQSNYIANTAIVEQYKSRYADISKGGSEGSVARHKQRGKLTARERIDLLLDEGSPFLELSALAAFDMYDNQAPSAGVVTGIGNIHGRQCMIVANDATVKGGTYFPMTIKKHVRAQQIAIKNHLPCIYLVDSGGIFLPYQSETFADKDHFGNIFHNQARLSAMGMPQIAVVMGSCTAGGAYVPAMSDETVMVKGQATIFIGGPPLVKAATGEIVTAEELGGAEVHTKISGVADHLANNDAHALEITRDIVANFGFKEKHRLDIKQPIEPIYDADEMLGVVPENIRVPFDIKEIIARLVDGSEFQEFKENYGTTLVTGFARIMGYPVGIIGNNGVLFGESSLKGAHFIELCTKRKIPLLFLQNITGFIVGKKYEHGAIASHGAKMVHAVANADVPKLTLIVAGSYGAGNYAMCGRGYDPNFLWMWPTGKISVMGGEQAATVLSEVKIKQLEKQGKTLSEKEIEDIKQPILELYEEQASPYYSTARLWDDGIILPSETRKVIALALSASLNKPIPETEYGIFRM